MIYLSWNCWGLGNSRTVRILGDLVKSRKPEFLFLYKRLSVVIKYKSFAQSLILIVIIQWIVMVIVVVNQFFGRGMLC